MDGCNQLSSSLFALLRPRLWVIGDNRVTHRTTEITSVTGYWGLGPQQLRNEG